MKMSLDDARVCIEWMRAGLGKYGSLYDPYIDDPRILHNRSYASFARAALAVETVQRHLPMVVSVTLRTDAMREILTKAGMPVVELRLATYGVEDIMGCLTWECVCGYVNAATDACNGCGLTRRVK